MNQKSYLHLYLHHSTTDVFRPTLNSIFKALSAISHDVKISNIGCSASLGVLWETERNLVVFAGRIANNNTIINQLGSAKSCLFLL